MVDIIGKFFDTEMKCQCCCSLCLVIVEDSIVVFTDHDNMVSNFFFVTFINRYRYNKL